MTTKGQYYGQIDKRVSTRLKLNNLWEHVAFVSQVEPKIINDALNDNN